MRHARGRQRLVVKLLIRPAPPTGLGPATASGQVAPRHNASHSGGHARSRQPTAHQPIIIRLQWRSSQSYRREPGTDARCSYRPHELRPRFAVHHSR